MVAQDSLSVVLPVHNGSATLSRRVADLLEFLPDLTSRFEVLILDNGSTDHTEEVAHELARDYPQLHAIRQSRRLNDEEVLELGLASTYGDLVIVYEEKTRISPRQLRQLWDLRLDKQLVVARTDKSNRHTLVDRLKNWASKLPPDDDSGLAEGGFQIIRRRALQDLPPNLLRIDLPSQKPAAVWSDNTISDTVHH